MATPNLAPLAWLGATAKVTRVPMAEKKPPKEVEAEPGDRFVISYGAPGCRWFAS